MDFDTAITKHSEWKLKFRNAMANHETMDAASITKDNCCEFGKWLYGEAKARFHSLPDYPKCVSDHAAFHVEAGKVAVAINAKKYAEAESMLATGTPYTKASFAVGGSIYGLKNASARM